MTRQRDAILREMGLAPMWRLRSADREGDSADLLPNGAQDGSPAAIEVPVVAAQPQRVPPQQAVLSHPSPALPLGASDAARDALIAGMEWDALEADIRACRTCRLCERRKQAVPGVGDRQADWLFVGEGPGAEEDQRGEPFVGAAGRLLDAMLAAIGLQRESGVYIANAVKCRPPHNRTPQADEIAACHPYLARQIALIRPRLIVALGRPAALALLGREIAIGASRGQLFDCAGVPLVVTYHPAYLLRNPADKAKAWEDLCFARRTMKAASGG